MNRKTKRIISRTITHTILILGTVIMLLPFFWMLTTSFKSLNEVFVSPPRFFGERLVWENYLRISSRFNYFHYFMNSISVSAWVVFFQLVTSCMAGFVFARLNFKFRDKLFLLYLATMMVPMHVIIIPNYLMMRAYGLINKLWSLMIPPMVSAFGTFLLRQFFLTVPRELDEAAKIDGCTPFGIFAKILMPMAGPTVATLGIFCFMYIWNDYFTPLILYQHGQELHVAAGACHHERYVLDGLACADGGDVHIHPACARRLPLRAGRIRQRYYAVRA